MIRSSHGNKTNARGFSLIELLIAMTIGGLALGAVSDVFVMQNKSYSVQEDVADMQQNARAAMDIMSGEIRMAGSDATGGANAGIVTAAANALNFTRDMNGDGDTSDADENISYSLYVVDGVQTIGRSVSGGPSQQVAANIQSLNFVYLDSAGSVTTTTANMRQIRLTITAGTARPDPDYPANGGYRTFTLSSLVTPRNLGY